MAREVRVLRCSNCGGHLSGSEAGDDLFECEGCGGHFVDHATLRALFERRARLSYRVDAPGSPGRKATPDRVRYLPCPVCGESMNRRNFGERSGIIVDVCRAHGIWFDHDELPRVLSFVAQGGLDDMTRRELEREREHLREQREALVQAFAHPATQQERPDPNTRWLERVLDILTELLRPG